VLTWFPGAHVGAGAPLLDRERFAALTAADRDIVWQRLFATLGGIDALYLRNVPEAGPDTPDLLCGVGVKQPSDSLHRAEFDSWQQADTAQRGKSRRKHDRQQGDRLAALGEVSFEEIPGGSAAAPAALDVMFRQRHDRFVEMGVSDPFVHCCVRAFYDRTVAPDSPVPVRLHVLRLDGEIVAVRYSIALGDTLYCLISSMSVDPRLRAGSPGKQCLLNVMQTVFDQGWRAFDMGAGFTDEKRHWCNVQLRLSHRYVPLNRRGAAISFLHRNWQALRRAMKSEQRSHSLLRRLRARLSRLTG
jgi:CelD/BcsL family acetyltransferase involved in cellulose biosynthesis